MSFARFSDTSDVYVYASGDNVYTCCGCLLQKGSLYPQWDFGGKAILAHLKEHKRAGHKVPRYCIKALKRDMR